MKTISIQNSGEVVTIDDIDFEKVSAYKWFLYYKKKNKRKQYVKSTTKINGKQLDLHVFILGKKEGFFNDHIDGNTLNCCRTNLRHVTHANNNRNKSSHTNSTSIFLGVCWSKHKKGWVATLCFNKKKVFCKQFKTEIEAAYTYNVVAEKYFGEFANLNKISAEQLLQAQQKTEKINVIKNILKSLLLVAKKNEKIKPKPKLKRTVSQDVRDRISKTLTGRKRPPEVIEKVRKSMLGKPAWNKGIPMSESGKQHLSKLNTGKNYGGHLSGENHPKSRKVINTLTGIIYASIIEAAEKNNIHHRALHSQLIGRVKNKTTLKFLEHNNDKP